MLTLVVLWGTAVAASLISAVPTVTVLIPFVQALVDQLSPATSPEVALGLWWALAAGACLGGNGTILGAAANMAVAGMSAKEREPISFAQYARKGIPLTAISLALATGYIALRYL